MTWLTWLLLATLAPAAAHAQSRWGADVTLGLVGGNSRDAFTERLDQFGYSREFMDRHPRYAISGRRWLGGPVWASASLGRLGAASWSRSADSLTAHYDWDSHALVGGVRVEQPIGEGGWFIPFAEGGIGVVRVTTRLVRYGDAGSTAASYSYCTQAAIGISSLGARRDHGQLGFVVRLGWSHAPALENNLGEVHDVGGAILEAGLNWGF